MRVAMLVHNGVVNDTRVIKSATTLMNADFDIDVHGISKTATSHPLTLKPSGVEVFLGAPSAKGFSFPLGLNSLSLNRLIDRAIFFLHSNYKNIVAVGCGLIGALAISLLGYWLLSGASAVYAAMTLTVLFGFSIFAVMLFRHYAPMLRRYMRIIINSLLGSHFGMFLLRISYTRLAKSLCDSVASRPDPDLIHIHDAVGLLAVKELKARYGCPIVWDAHEIYEDMASLEESRAQFVKSIIRENEGDIDGFITINESIAEFYRQNYQLLPEASVVMNATAKCDPSEYDGRLHAAAGLPRDQRVVLYQGGFGPKRGLAELIGAAVNFKAGWTLVMMGWGSMEQELRDLAVSLASTRDEKKVVFVPGAPQDELQFWTAGGSIGLIPYENTGLNHLYCTPNKLWEYPNAGVPILCSDLIEMAKMVKEYGTGRVFARDFTAEDISNAVNSLTDSDLATMRANCAAFVEVNNWSHYEPRILALYSSLGIHPHKTPNNLGNVPLHAVGD